MDDERTLYGRAHELCEIAVGVPLDLLQHTSPVHVRLRTTGHRDHWNRINERRRQSGDRVHRPGPDRRNGRQGSPARPEVGIRDMGSRLLMSGLDQGQLLLPVFEGVKDPHVPVARDAAHVRHSLCNQIIGEDLAS